MDNLIGKRLDGLYEVQELIGSGGMANVYKAVMRGQNGPVPAGTVVAVKVLRREYMHDPDLVRRFKNESKAISLLNHPNIVKVYDVSVNDHLQYIVMEYVDGMTLREYLNERGGKLSSRETVHFISQILKALEHAHANGVVHRDIKPQNIMLLDNGQLRMMDFGIARISRADNQMLAGKAMGSVHYISPEQAKGDETDRTSDIYSVGVMMYEMLSGHLPFDADDVVEVAIKQISDEPRSLHELAPEVPYALVEITEKAMAKLPQNRYPSARAMLEALDTYVQNPSVLFEYQYITEEAPEKVVKRTMNQNRAIRQNEQPAPRKKGKGKPGKKRRTVFLPALFGITIAFALACMALCWMILNDSSNLMNSKADVTLGDYIGMTKDQAMATDQIASGQISPEWEEEYNSNYAAGYIYKQSPVSGRTVREGQSVTLTVSLGTQYVTVPDLTNYVQTDAEQQLKALGVSVLVTQAVEKHGVQLLPVDSEHSAIFQCLQDKESAPSLTKILLTASGGPFFGMTTEQLRGKTRADALKHPNWNMGAKITIDSATLMNKGLELIEAVWLFGLPPEKIQIVVQRQSIVHSAVQFSDNSIIAQLGVPDMRIPIQYALTYPKRVPGVVPELDFTTLKLLTFDVADEETFRCLAACKKAIRKGGLGPCAANGANEEAVKLFLEDKIGFLDIGRLVEAVVDSDSFGGDYTLADVYECDRMARAFVRAHL